MHDFSEDLIPRAAPRPTLAESENQQKWCPSVPEISLIFDKSNKVFDEPKKSIQIPNKSYSSWKREQQQQVFQQPLQCLESIKSNYQQLPIVPQITGTTKKEVRFQNSQDKINSRHSLDLSLIATPVTPVFNGTVPHQMPSPVISVDKPYDQEQENSKENPSVKDLFELIQKQQEQLITLQQQVERLLTIKEHPVEKKDVFTENKVNVPCKNDKQCSPIPKYIDCGIQCHLNETETNEKIAQLSIGVMTSFEVRYSNNQQPSNDNQNTNRENSVASPSWTFYGNVLGQVDKILQNSSPSQENIQKIQSPIFCQQQQQVQIQQLLNGGKKYTDRSLAMNILAMKYLPVDKLNEVISNNPVVQQQMKNSSIGANKMTDMSIATYRYMEKYGLLEAVDDKQKNNKFLDITTIKNQPKLL